MEGKRKSSNKLKRVQSGNIHVFFRGNSRNTVFYDDIEREVFLKKLKSYSNKLESRILAFILMDNHVHIQLITNCLSVLFSNFLRDYSKWYNSKKGLSDKLFKTPFSSACKYSDEWVLNSNLYILNNPIKAGICKHPSEYKWSSYHFHHNRPNPLSSIIDVDTGFVDSIFKTKEELDNAIINFLPDIGEIKERGRDRWTKTPDYIINKHLLKTLNGQNLFTLDKDETKKMIITLRRETGASYRQIASIMHESSEYVKRVLTAYFGATN
ncbi:MAG TPA: hypothetical protein DEG92_01140 [Rikenellaceae bacterium]|nr:hypothetical protein [Rikenellaceae bacterium]